MAMVAVDAGYGDGAGNTVEENLASSIFSLIRMR